MATLKKNITWKRSVIGMGVAATATIEKLRSGLQQT
jgi:hypothetical protein